MLTVETDEGVERQALEAANHKKILKDLIEKDLPVSWAKVLLLIALEGGEER